MTERKQEVPAHEHEGVLGRPGTREAEAKIRRLKQTDLQGLSRDERFRRWFGGWAEAHLLIDVPAVDAVGMAHFLGARSVMLRMMKEIEKESPGFYERVLEERRELTEEMRHTPQEEE